MSIGVAIAHDDAQIVEDVAEAIDRADGLHLVPSAQRGADVTLAGRSFLGRTIGNVIVLSGGSDPEDARAGFSAGARGWLRWPQDAADLVRAIAAAAPVVPDDAGRLVVVASARGGAGATTVAAMLGALGHGLVVDLDGGQRVYAAEDVAADGLARVLASPVAEVAEHAAVAHAAGRALLGGLPPDAEPSQVRQTLDAARRCAPVVVVDAGRLGPNTLELGGELVVVLADDIESLRVARALLDDGAHARFVLNRRRRRGIRGRHVQRALRVDPIVLHSDPRIARAADLGSLPKRLPRALAEVVA